MKGGAAHHLPQGIDVLTNMNKNIDFYMKLPYTYLIHQVNDESGNYFFGKVLELDGVQSDGDTFEDKIYKRLCLVGWKLKLRIMILSLCP